MQKILIVASSLDGYIAQSRQQVSTAWTSREDRQFFAKISRQIGVLIMGAPTYATIGRPLPERQIIVMCRPGECSELPEVTEREVQLNTVWRSDSRAPADLLAVLESQGLRQVAICGGARVYQSFLTANLVDELYVTIEPVFLGGGIKLTPDGMVSALQRFEVVEKIDLSTQTTVWHLKPMDNETV
ncbi:dihydrofolate reductase [bacterium]|nr:dihydrofolate reductase [bacterium]